MGRRRVKTGHLQQQESPEKGGSVDNIARDGVDATTPPGGSTESCISVDSDSEDEIPSSQPLGGAKKTRRSSKHARKSMKLAISAKSSRRKEIAPKEEVSGVVMTTCPVTGDQCLAVLAPNIIHFHRRASSQHLWMSDGSIQLPSLSSFFSKPLSLLATQDSQELQIFIAAKKSVKEVRMGVVRDITSNTSTILLTEKEEVVTEVFSCNLTSTSAAVFWNVDGGRSNGAVYDWGTVEGVKKQTLTHLASWSNVTVTGVAKIEGKRMVAASTCHAFVSVWNFDTGQRLSRLNLDTVGLTHIATPGQLIKMATESEHTFCFVLSGTCLRVLVVRPDYPATQTHSLEIPAQLAESLFTGVKVMVQGPTISLLVAGAIVRWSIQKSSVTPTVSYIGPPFRNLDLFFN